MQELTSYERILRMYNHQDADRVPIVDYPWASTIERWRREGLPRGADYRDFFGLDKVVEIHVDNSPQFPVRVLEETEEYIKRTSRWGATEKRWKHAGGTPEFLDFTVVDWDSWLLAKERMRPTPDRIDWPHLQKNYKRWRKEGYWITAYFWFGFDVLHSWMVGTERVLMAMATDPEWVRDMMGHFLEVDLKLFTMIWDAGYRFDEITWPDDMGYKLSQFFSVKMYRDIVKPIHEKAANWAHARGIKVKLHSCGDIRPFIPDLLEIGIEMLNPLEVKAGINPVQLKKAYGDQLAFHGGINAVLYENDDLGEMLAEIERVLPIMKENGGYIFASDHSVPDSVSLQSFREIVDFAKKIGSY